MPSNGVEQGDIVRHEVITRGRCVLHGEEVESLAQFLDHNTDAPLTVLAHACAAPDPPLKSALQGVRKHPSDSTHT